MTARWALRFRGRRGLRSWLFERYTLSASYREDGGGWKTVTWESPRVRVGKAWAKFKEFEKRLGPLEQELKERQWGIDLAKGRDRTSRGGRLL